MKGDETMNLSVEICQKLRKMGFPQDRRQPVWGSLDDEPFELYNPGNRRLQLYGSYMAKYACPSELEVLEWLEDEHSDHWRYARDEDGLWYVQNGEKPTRKTYREIGRFRAPSELLLAIYENWMSRQTDPDRSGQEK